MKDYEDYLTEIRQEVEDRIKEIATNGHFTTEEVEELEDLIDFIKTLPINAYELNRGGEWLQYTN